MICQANHVQRKCRRSAPQNDIDLRSVCATRRFCNPTSDSYGTVILILDESSGRLFVRSINKTVLVRPVRERIFIFALCSLPLASLGYALQSPNPSHIDKITSATISFGFGALCEYASRRVSPSDGRGRHPHERQQAPHPQTGTNTNKGRASRLGGSNLGFYRRMGSQEITRHEAASFSGTSF